MNSKFRSNSALDTFGREINAFWQTCVHLAHDKSNVSSSANDQDAKKKMGQGKKVITSTWACEEKAIYHRLPWLRFYHSTLSKGRAKLDLRDFALQGGTQRLSAARVRVSVLLYPGKLPRW